MRCASGFSQPRITDSGNAAMAALVSRAVSRAYSMRRKLPSRSPSIAKTWQTATLTDGAAEARIVAATKTPNPIRNQKSILMLSHNAECLARGDASVRTQRMTRIPRRARLQRDSHQLLGARTTPAHRAGAGSANSSGLRAAAWMPLNAVALHLERPAAGVVAGFGTVAVFERFGGGRAYSATHTNC